VAIKEDRVIDIAGYFRTRFDLYENFDLNRGPTPTTGQTIFPVPASNPSGLLTSGNMRLRLEPTIRVGWGVAVHARIDLLDNVVFGSTPEGLPASVQAPMSGGSVFMRPPEAGTNAEVDSIRVKRAWGEVLLPFGLLSVGRMGALIDWGTGFFVNSGNCLDCDQGDVGDRVAFATPIADHILAFAFDFGASGPTSATLRALDAQPFDLDRSDDVRSWALAFARYNSDPVVRRYVGAGRWVVNYGLLAAIRTQEYDVPAYYYYGNLRRVYGADELVSRGLFACSGDLWLGIRRGHWTLDVEAALLYARVENSSLLPGVATRDAIRALQLGGVVRSLHRWERLELEAQAGLASGDPAPGLGYRAPLSQLSTQPGDLDGPQIAVPADLELNNFRFNPDYHVDLILWRQIIGTVTDAFYGRIGGRYSPLRDLWLGGAAIVSTALEPDSTPSGELPLGVELNLTASYQLEPGFEAHLGYGVLVPLSGLRNVRFDLDPEPAQTLHLLLAFRVD
jgi:uncharacterized protein (TIGR04551 family)